MKIKYTLVKRVRIIGQIYEKKKAHEFCKEKGFHVKEVGGSVGKFFIMAEKKI